MAKDGVRYCPGEWIGRQVTVVKKGVAHNVDIHMHTFYEMEFVVGGKGRHNINGYVHTLKPGDLTFLTPIDFHSIFPEDSIDLINISFTEEIISPQFQNLFMNSGKNMVFSLDEQECATFCSLAELLAEECDSDDAFAHKQRESILRVLLVFVARRMEGLKAPVGERDISPIQTSVQYLFEHFRENITLQNVAQVSGYSTNYFSKIFKELTGRRYTDFLNALRVNYACMLLASTDQTVIEISEGSGFESLSNFLRVFKNQTGQTPIGYRKSRRDYGRKYNYVG